MSPFCGLSVDGHQKCSPAVAGIGYYGYLEVKSTVPQLAELGQVADIERGVRIRTPFAVPESHEMTATQVDRLYMSLATFGS